MQLQTLSGNWHFRQTGTDEWLPARVPGDVHTDLLAAGRIPDPFVGDNEQHVQWAAETDWEYYCNFNVSPALLAEEQVWLVCDGLDTLVEVRLNGQLVGCAENMFRSYRWDVRGLLSPAENELSIAFASPVRFAAEHQAVRALPGVPQAIPGGPYLRKAPCQFGWDWGPQLPPIGVWKDIRLECWSTARIADVHLRQEHSGGQVTVSAEVRVEAWSQAQLKAVVWVTAPDDSVIEGGANLTPQPPLQSEDGFGEGGPAAAEAVVSVTVEEPELWWPNGYGSQPLYTVEVSLQADGAVEVLDRQEYKLGLRTVALRQQPDEWGRSFEFVVNGVRIFAKGSNWIPADSFPTRITDDHLEALIRSAAETHQNMLRVWGGGFYEDERFYDLCDRYGILVWQDFIFSCSIYPLNDPAFLENVRVEVAENVRRLRHRACLALWCGNNEMEQGWVEWSWDKPALQDLKDAYRRFFHHTLPEWVAADDPNTPYWPSTPSSDTPFEDPNGQRQGDAHYWDVWHGRKPFTAYRSQFPRFMSEFGFQALPPLETIRTFAEPADWNLTSYILEQHQKNASGNSLIITQMTDNFRLPKDFPALVYLSGVLQAEGIRYGVEHWRRHKHRVAGTIYWQLNDCWPVASWSSLDYYGRWKSLHYAARRFYAPLLLSIEDHPPRQAIHVTSDLGEPWEGEIAWSLETLSGEALASGQEPVRVAPYASLQVCDLDFSRYLTDGKAREVVFVAELLQGDQTMARQTAYFAPAKHLTLADPAIVTDLREDNGCLRVDLVAQSLARLVEVSLEGADVVLSDNYFDLPAGREAVIRCPLPAGWTLEQARAALKIRSVYDSYDH